MAHSPPWLQIVSLAERPALTLSADLDQGEYDAIRLALDCHADLVLMDEREGVEQARRLGLTVTGTVGVLDRAAERKVLDLRLAFTHFRQTSFRIDPALLDRLLTADSIRREKWFLAEHIGHRNQRESR